MQKLVVKFTEAYLLPQEKKWVRFLDALAAFFCLICAAIALYFIKTQYIGILPAILEIVIWTYLLSSLPLAFLLYRESNLKKYERLALALFLLAISMNLLHIVLSGYR
jgi:uncharacterized membrane protein YoaK (UPF0700 family)